MDSRIDLQQPVLDGGIRSINFFNGRLLSARDLTREQTANREADRRLGQAVGDGIAYGLEVSKTTGASNDSPAVSVAAGLAINRRGQTLMLAANTDVALVRSTEGNGGIDNFSDCLPLQTGAYVAGAGAYLLTLAPAQSSEGRATTNGMNPTASCNTDTIVTAVQFRLIQIDPPITDAELQDQDHLRNLIAYKCFGVSETEGFITDPFAAEVNQWGLLDSLRPDQLTDCEVPLAVLYWTQADGISFVDMWSVRRRLSRRSPNGNWNALLDDRLMAEGEARLQQFTAQISELVTFQSGNLMAIKAGDFFKYLPAVGVIPLGGVGSAVGFDQLQFFQSSITRPVVYMPGALLQDLLRQSFSFPPIDLNSPEVIWLYMVRENMEAFDQNPILGSIQPYLVFSNGQIPYRGVARFDLADWSYSNFV
jgi:hypothetical protein